MAKRKAATRSKARSATKGLGSGMARKAAKSITSRQDRMKKRMKDIYK